MIIEASRYEGLLKSLGTGAFGKVEYLSETEIVLRTGSVKTADLSGTVRLYFNNQRGQTLSGRRFDPMPSGLVLMRPGMFYRVYSTLEIVEPLPIGVSALVVLNEDTRDVMSVTTGPFREGYIGPVCFTIQPFRKIEMEKMTSLGSLMFFEDAVVPIEVSEDTLKSVVKEEVKKALKNGTSVRTKKSTTSVGKKTTGSKKAEGTGGTSDEGGISDKHPDNPES